MLSFFFYFTIAVVFIIIFIFASPQLSPIPYFPSQLIDLPLIIKSLNIRNDQIIIDLGAGDGIIIFEAASFAYKKKLNTQFVAVEINPILIFVLHSRRLFHSNRNNIKIVRDDIFKIKVSKHGIVKHLNRLTVYLYISPWHLEKTVSNIKKQVNKFSTVSYMYSIKSLKDKEKIILGKNKIYIYP